MKQTHSNPPAVIIKHDGRAIYLGHMSVVPREGETIWLGSNPHLISRVEWDFNTGSGSWEVELFLSR